MEMFDYTGDNQMVVELEIGGTGRVVWVHVNGITKFRICRIGELRLIDHRQDGLELKHPKMTQKMWEDLHDELRQAFGMMLVLSTALALGIGFCIGFLWH